MTNDTIVAISTPYGESGIGIVRISGEKSFEIADRIFRRSDQKRVLDLADHSINYGWIVDPKSKKAIDEVFLSVLKSPKTYTREDMIEINCHGGWVAMNKAMEAILELGARIADPGEFTKRAYLNGRIDLSQAEAVLEIIRAGNDRALSFAVKRLNGSIKNKTREIRDKIFKLLTLINARIDFDDQLTIESEAPGLRLNEIINEVERLIERYERTKGEVYGIKTVVCGRPNVGKSSIVNAIYGEERIITSGIAGTTRDSISVEIFLNGIIYNLIDTAGIKEGRTVIERLSVEKSREEIKGCDCIIMVFDLSRRISKEDRKIVEWINGLRKEIIWTGNKRDLKRRINAEALAKMIKNEELIEISAIEENGTDRIISELKERHKRITRDVDIGGGLVINKRQSGQLYKAKGCLLMAQETVVKGLSEELLAYELSRAIEELDRITGERKEKDVLSEVFSQFCVGK